VKASPETSVHSRLICITVSRVLLLYLHLKEAQLTHWAWCWILDREQQALQQHS